MREPTITAVRRRLRKHRGCYSKICRTGGITYSWLTKFATGERGRHPSFDLIQRLIAALDAFEAGAVKITSGKTLAKPRRKVAARRAAKKVAS